MATAEELSLEILQSLGQIGLWLQAIGAIVIIWLAFQITNFLINRKRLKKLEKITERLEIIEEKIEKQLG